MVQTTMAQAALLSYCDAKGFAARRENSRIFLPPVALLVNEASSSVTSQQI
jgi:hypothetical protein